MANKPQHIIVHHSVTPRDLNKDVTESSFNNSHKARGFPASYLSGNTWYIGYHYVIYGDGEVRQYRTSGTVGAHCKEENMNYKSIGVCMVGNFDIEHPSEGQISSLKELVTGLREDLEIPKKNIWPHRKYATYKSCYGTNLPDDPNELLDAILTPHWSDESMEWMLEHKILTMPKDPNSPVLWGEFAVVSKRLAERILEWTK